jgi:hypothetical protein
VDSFNFNLIIEGSRGRERCGEKRGEGKRREGKEREGGKERKEILQHLDLFDVVLGKDGSRATDATEIEPSVLLTCVCHLFTSVSFRECDEAASVLHQQVNISLSVINPFLLQ